MKTIMKILAISGSPQRDSSYILLNNIKKYFADNGYHDFKILELSKIKLKTCIKCSACVSKGENHCPNKDMRDTIINKMKQADVIIFSSPVFAVAEASLMKNFINRLGYFGHRPYFFDKYAMVITSGSGFGVKETNEHMKKVFTAYGFNVVSDFQVNSGLWLLSKKEKEIIENKAIKAAGKLIESINRGNKNPPNLNQVVVFRIFKSISESNRDNMPVNYEYYKNKKDYYYDIRLNMFKKMYAKIVTRNL
jgi:multimeric flavodoxin WrbA